MSCHDKMNTKYQEDKLSKVWSECIQWSEYITCNSSIDSGFIVDGIKFLEFISEIIHTIKGHYYLEIIQTLLDFCTHSAQRLKTRQCFSLYPRRDQLSNNQNAQCWEKWDNPKFNIKGNDKYCRSDNKEKISEKLRKCLRKKLIQFISIIVDTRYQVSCLILIEERKWKLLNFREKLIAKMKKGFSTNSTHYYCLNIRSSCTKTIYSKQKKPIHKEIGIIMVHYRCIHSISNNYWSNKGGCRTKNNCNSSNNKIALLTIHKKP